MNPETIFYIINAIIILGFVFERYVDYLNLKSMHADLPDNLSKYYDSESYGKSVLYHKAKDSLSKWGETLSFIAILLFLWFRGFSWLNHILEGYIHDPVLLALAYFGVLALASGILSLPFGIYNTFVIEEKFGFNKTTLKTFILDKIKGILLTLILGGGIGYLFLWIILHLGSNFWLFAWAAAIIITLFLNIFYTSLLLPIFNKLTPLPEGELRTKIETYAKSVSFPLTNIMVINGSKRSTKANAFFSGMGRSKKIVLYDTLIEKQDDEELVSILAHEVGHYKKKHIITSMILSWIQTGFILWILSKFIFSENLSFALGAAKTEIHMNLIAFGILFEPISLITGILMNMYSRKNEYEADHFAVTTSNPSAFKNALIQLSTDNLSNLTPHPSYVFIHYSHPTLLQRLNAIDIAKVSK